MYAHVSFFPVLHTTTMYHLTKETAIQSLPVDTDNLIQSDVSDLSDPISFDVKMRRPSLYPRRISSRLAVGDLQTM
jgi:hypothetical protein